MRSQSESYNKISNKTNKFDFLTEQKSEERKKSLRALAPHSYNWAKFTITSGTLSLAFLIFFESSKKGTRKVSVRFYNHPQGERHVQRQWYYVSMRQVLLEIVSEL